MFSIINSKILVNLYGNETSTNATFSDQQSTEEPTVTHEYYVPKIMKVSQQPSSLSNESVPFPLQPQIQLYDVLNRWCVQLGSDLAPWSVTATLVPSVGSHADSKLSGQTTVNFVNGTASFTDLQITHQGSGYKIKYHVSYPADVNFEVIDGTEITINERQLGFRFKTDVTTAKEMFSIEPQPRAYVYDLASGEDVTTLGAQGRKWVLEAEIESSNAELIGTTKVYFNETMAEFTDLGVNKAGEDYHISYKIYTEPSSQYASEKHLSSAFTVQDRSYHLRVVQQPGECNDTIACGKQPIIEVRSEDVIATHLNWDSKEWHVTVTQCQGNTANNPLKGTTRIAVNETGVVNFNDLRFDNVAQNYKLCFQLEVTPGESKYDDIKVESTSFNVVARKFYLSIKTQPGEIVYIWKLCALTFH